MRLVISISSGALLRDDERADAATQQWHVRRAARALAPVVRDHEVVVCHGNTAQLSTLARESENDDTLSRPFPLDALGAQAQGLLGYWIVRELVRADVGRQVTALVTQTVVAADRSGQHGGRMFVGPPYTRQQIQSWAGELGWQFGNDNGVWRRSVPAFEPNSVIELPTIAALLAIGTCVVCAGGGGVPVRDAGSDTGPVDGIVDADLTACRLAIDLGADRLMMIADGFRPEAVAEGTGVSTALGRTVQAARRFADATGRPAAVGAIDMVSDMLAGRGDRHVVVAPRTAATGAS